MVIIIDPHVSITEGYHVYEQLKKNSTIDTLYIYIYI